MSKLKIGDKVRITKPEEPEETCWIEGMERFIGKVSEKEFISSNNASADLEDTVYGFPLSSLTLVEETTEQVTGQVTEQPTEQVVKNIDWEQRRWEMASKIFAETEDITLDSAVRQADIFIKYYKQTLK